MYIGSAFVSFKYEHFKDYILAEYERNPEDFTIKGKQLYIERANHPDDVRWENLRISNQVRKSRVKYSKYIMGCVLIVSFFLLGLLNVAGFTLENWIEANFRVKSFRNDWVFINRSIFSLIITLFNTFISAISEKMVIWERHTNSTAHFQNILGLIKVHIAVNSLLKEAALLSQAILLLFAKSM